MLTPKQRVLALLDDGPRDALDRVPTFAQAVNPDFIMANEDTLFQEEPPGGFTNAPGIDAAIILGFDGIFGDIPRAYVAPPVEITGADGETHVASAEGRETHAGTRFYKGGLVSSHEVLDALRTSIIPAPGPDVMRKVLDHAGSLDRRIFVVPKTGGLFSRVLLGMGYEGFARHYRQRSRLYRDFIAFRADLLRADIENLVAGGGATAGAVFITDDIAYKGRPMIPPGRFLDDFGHHYKEILGIARDAGIVPLLHTDGDITEMVPAFQEVGFRGVQGWEGGCDPRVIADKFPDFVTIGFGDMNRILPFGTRPEVEAHVDDLMDALKANRRFAIGPSSVVNATMPLDNVRWFVARARARGAYLPPSG